MMGRDRREVSPLGIDLRGSSDEARAQQLVCHQKKKKKPAYINSCIQKQKTSSSTDIFLELMVREVQ